MKPYFSRDGIVLYHGDAREVLSEIPNHSQDLIVTDPPYGVSWQSGRRAEKFEVMAGDEDLTVATEVLGISLKKLRPYRHIYAFGKMPMEALPVISQVELIWDKCQPSAGNLELPWGSAHEYIQFSVYVPGKHNREKGYGKLSVKLRKGTILRVNKPVGAAVRHPSEKPVLLLRQLIESSSVIGETVLDPFVGVGSTLVAAAIEGRCAVGIEIEERFCETAATRLSKLVLPSE